VTAFEPAPAAAPTESDAAPVPDTAGQRVLIVMPTWFGDCLMATPALRALRAAFPGAHVEAMIREPLAPLLEGLPFLDGVVTHGGGVKRSGKGRSSGGGRGSSPFGMAKRLSRMKFDVAVLLPNSFRSAALVTMAGIKRRIGYDRDGRGMLLTDRLVPRHDGKDYVPVPALEYYLSIAAYLGAPAVNGTDAETANGTADGNAQRRRVPAAADHRMEVATRAEDDVRAASMLEPAKGRPVVLLNPGAAKVEKRWPPQSFAQLAGRLHDELGLAVAVTGAPDEREVVARVAGAAPCRVIDLLKAGATLGQLKSVVKLSRVVVTNDTGPRHLSAALGTPVVTLFGPTLPAWTEIGFAHERKVTAAEPAAVDAMRQITVSRVFDATAGLMAETEPRDPEPDPPSARASGRSPAKRGRSAGKSAGRA